MGDLRKAVGIVCSGKIWLAADTDDGFGNRTRGRFICLPSVKISSHIMLKLITASLFALVVSVASVEAGPSKKIFQGAYDGSLLLQNSVGDSIVYSPLRFKISISGVVTGTAYNSNTQKTLAVKGAIGKVTVMSGIDYRGKVTGTFSDGTKWSAIVSTLKGLPYKTILGKATKGSYSGQIALNNL